MKTKNSMNRLLEACYKVVELVERDLVQFSVFGIKNQHLNNFRGKVNVKSELIKELQNITFQKNQIRTDLIQTISKVILRLESPYNHKPNVIRILSLVNYKSASDNELLNYAKKLINKIKLAGVNFSDMYLTNELIFRFDKLTQNFENAIVKSIEISKSHEDAENES